MLARQDERQVELRKLACKFDRRKEDSKITSRRPEEMGDWKWVKVFSLGGPSTVKPDQVGTTNNDPLTFAALKYGTFQLRAEK